MIQNAFLEVVFSDNYHILKSIIINKTTVLLLNFLFDIEPDKAMICVLLNIAICPTPPINID